MAVIEHLALVSPTEGSAPSLPTGWANAGSGAQFEVRAAAAFIGDSWGIRLPTMSTSFRRIEYTFSDGALTSGTRVWSFWINPTAFSTSVMIIASMVDGTTGKTEIRFNTTGTNRTISLRNLANGSTSATTSTSFATGTPIRLEYGLTIGGNLELRIYSATGALIESVTLAATLITQVTKAYFGVNAAAASWAADYSLPNYANDWLTTSASGAASLSLSASGSAAGPGGGSATASLSLSGSGAARAAGAASAALSLSAAGSAAAASRFTFVPKYPVTAAHRGGMPNGEETWEAYGYSLNLVPDAALEYDLQSLSDGGLALLHDATIDRTADASSPITTGSASALTTAQFQSVIMTPQAAGGVTGHGRIIDEMASRYPTQLHLPEIKTGADYSAAITAIINLGLAPRSIVQSFSYTAATAAAAAGLEVVYEMASGDSHTFSQIKADGINHVMRNKTLWNSTDITSAKAAGLKTWIFTVDTTAERDTWLGNGIDGGFISGYPAVIHMTGVGIGSITLSATGGAKGAAAGSASLSLSGAGAGVAASTASATLSLSGSGTARVAGAATAALSLSASAASSSPVTGAGALTLSASGVAVGPGGGAGTASLSLTGTGAAQIVTGGTASLSLTGGAASSSPVAGSASITLSGAGADQASVTGASNLTLFAAATARAAVDGLASLNLGALAGATASGGSSNAALSLNASGSAFGVTAGDGIPVARPTATITSRTPTAEITTETPTAEITTQTRTAALIGA